MHNTKKKAKEKAWEKLRREDTGESTRRKPLLEHAARKKVLIFVIIQSILRAAIQSLLNGKMNEC